MFSKIIVPTSFIFFTSGDNLLSLFAPVAVMICSNPTTYKNAELRSSAALALSRFMMVR